MILLSQPLRIRPLIRPRVTWETTYGPLLGVHVRTKPVHVSISMSCEQVDNRDTLELILSRPIGILSLLDEESKFPSSSDKTLNAKLHANLANSRSYVPSRGDDMQVNVVLHT